MVYYGLTADGRGRLAFEGALLRGVGHGGHLEGGRCRCALEGLAGVAHDGGELMQQRAKAVCRGAIGQGVGCDFRERRFGTRRRGHRIAASFGFKILIGKQQLAPGFAHVPLDVVGQHAQEHVRSDAVV